jgi:hypothetical protein
MNFMAIIRLFLFIYTYNQTRVGMKISFGNTQDNKIKVDNMHFAPQMPGIVEPSPISNDPLKKHLASLRQEKTNDTYESQNEPAALNLGHEALHAAETSKSGLKRFLLSLGTIILGGLFIFNKKSRQLVSGLFAKNKQPEIVMISTKDKIDEAAKALFEKLKSTPIEKFDIKSVQKRFIGEKPSEIKETLTQIMSLAKEYSHYKEGKPEIIIKLKESSQFHEKKLQEALKAGNIEALSNKILSRIEAVELQVLDKGHAQNITNNIGINTHTRIIGNTAVEIVSKNKGLWQSFKDWYTA